MTTKTTTAPRRAPAATFDARSSFTELLQIVQAALAAGLGAGVAHERFVALLVAARAALDPRASVDVAASLVAWAARTSAKTQEMVARPPRARREKTTAA